MKVDKRIMDFSVLLKSLNENYGENMEDHLTGIKENDIPLAAKILAIADTYSAITMRRSYKDPRTHEDAIKIIKDVAGTQLDKSLVDVFVTIPKDELQKCIPEQVKY